MGNKDYKPWKNYRGSLPENTNLSHSSKLRYDLDQPHNEKMATQGMRNTYSYNANHGRFSQPQHHLGQRDKDLHKGIEKDEIRQLHERWEQGKLPTSAYRGITPISKSKMKRRKK